MKKVRMALVILLVISIIICCIVFQKALMEFDGYSLDISSENKEDFIELLEKNGFNSLLYYSKVDENPKIDINELKNVKTKRGFRNTYIMFYNDENELSYKTLVKDSSDVVSYIEKEGKKAETYFDKAYMFFKNVPIVIIILMFSNEMIIIINYFKNRKTIKQRF